MMIDVTPMTSVESQHRQPSKSSHNGCARLNCESQFNRFSRQENEIIIGTVQSVSPHGVTLHLERTEEATMPKREQIPGVTPRHPPEDPRVRVLEVRRTPRGPEIIVSQLIHLCSVDCWSSRFPRYAAARSRFMP